MSVAIVPGSSVVVNYDRTVPYLRSGVPGVRGVANPAYDETGFTKSKQVLVHEFPDSVECFIDVGKRTWGDMSAADVQFCIDEAANRGVRGEGDREANSARAARRAKTNLRRKCKMIRANCMITLTYRAVVTDQARVQADFKAFRKRLSSLGQFHYVAALETQERGSLHIHIACQALPAYINQGGVRVKSFDVLRAMWYRVVGRGNGACNVRVPRGRNSPHRIASYIGKYVAKGIEEGVFNKKSYWSSQGIPKPVVSRQWLDSSHVDHQIITELATQWFALGYTEVSQYYSPEGEFYWFSCSRP